jgi:hypothetical protein
MPAALVESWPSKIISANLAADGTGHARKNIIRVTADKAHRAYDDYQNHRQHNRVLGNVLTLFL